MPRPHKRRRVEFLPELTHFKPAGIPLKELEEICLTVEELEAIRLKDLEGLDQEACAKKMHVSRPTFQRVLHSARAKIAETLVKGKALKVEGGNYRLAMRKFHCHECDYRWEVPFGTGETGLEMKCPSCQSTNLEREETGAGGHWGRGKCRRQMHRGE